MEEEEKAINQSSSNKASGMDRIPTENEHQGQQHYCYKCYIYVYICMLNINIYSMRLNLINLQVHMLIYSVSTLYCWAQIG